MVQLLLLTSFASLLLHYIREPHPGCFQPDRLSNDSRHDSSHIRVARRSVISSCRHGRYTRSTRRKESTIPTLARAGDNENGR